MANDQIPSWDRDPNTFERFATNCRWYSNSLKSSARPLAAPRVWHKLTGSAKSVVRNLDPEQYIGTDGLEKLLQVLRKSPLQRLPIPDTFQRLERWTGMTRRSQESIPELLVREEELFTELQQSLLRARSGPDPGKAVPHDEEDSSENDKEAQAPPGREGTAWTAGASPKKGATSSAEKDKEAPSQEKAETRSATSTPTSRRSRKSCLEKGFFEEELRAYRLSKSAVLSQTERQQVLTLTGNSTRFQSVRQALRALHGDGVLGYASEKTWDTYDESWEYPYGEDEESY